MPTQASSIKSADQRSEPVAGAVEFGSQFGLLPRQKIEVMVRRGMIMSPELDNGQIQPASLDLRLGPKAYRIRASFLPGKDRTVEGQLANLNSEEISLEGHGAVLERGCVYVIPLLESLKLPESISAIANPKSSTGRLDIFTRLITDRSEVFDRAARAYEGPLYAEVSPRSFSIRVRRGTRLNQIRFRRLNSQQLERNDFSLDEKELRERHEALPLVDGPLNLRNGLVLRVALSREPLGPIIGYRAQKHADILDVDRVGAYAVSDYWEPILAREDQRLILDPGEFYILASHEKLHIPPDLAAEMVPIDPAMGEFRVHYAGFFDPGFGHTVSNLPGARAVLEVRSREVPFILENGQVVGRLVYEKMAEAPLSVYGQLEGAHYQGQGLKLSKHFQEC
ncbi:2'-deoxycytidine 5'-triphosphate deaminase [Beijerinckia indica]|uniref:2-deoxycytidine 5-triphosphate deaminase n=1 Tax=Beijerinckia indica subsp. indica (strain ATCC 9039 / DSM 1715 / NCIMB 8712) TaxID=395963 RepID=B2III7_BEII9|nr:2'-deoxycytidine 5'-triphosphate deaminase [Beijerinckia indica]ACB94680.1 2-deoxycytidine 5-triphosphate deaminase [Beijerinckia indica subsp. indica ATCC 9039]